MVPFQTFLAENLCTFQCISHTDEIVETHMPFLHYQFHWLSLKYQRNQRTILRSVMVHLRYAAGISDNKTSVGHMGFCTEFRVFPQLQDYGRPSSLDVQQSLFFDYPNKLFLSSKLIWKGLLGRFVRDPFGVAVSTVPTVREFIEHQDLRVPFVLFWKNSSNRKMDFKSRQIPFK